MKTPLNLLLLVALSVGAFAQQPASYGSLSARATFGKELGYEGTGKGGAASIGIRLPDNLYVTQEFGITSERKLGSGRGTTLESVTGLERYFASGFSGRAAVQIADHDNSVFDKTVVRAHLGGTWRWLDKLSEMPYLQVRVVGIAPLRDSGKLWGVKAELAGFYALGDSPFGLTARVIGAQINARDSLTNQRGWARYGAVEAGLFVNLSTIRGW